MSIYLPQNPDDGSQVTGQNTSQWQYPANPADGDVIVRGNLLATYVESRNTWLVSEVPTSPGVPGPPGPPGPTGPPGQGVNITGAVPTQNDLPAPNTTQFEFWIVDDTNTLYYSDGIQWIDFGSPIRGPQGETGNDGNNGTDGSNGRGWYGTTIIDQRDESPPNYQITFNSNDGLDFTTDNIMGAAGDVGEIPVASATRLGGIKIGRGLNILPDGTAQAGETNVDLETVPLTPEGTVYNYNTFSLSFVPGYFNKPDDTNWSTTGYATGPTSTQSGTIEIPELSDGGIFYFFTGSDVGNNFNPPGGYGLSWTVYAQLRSLLTLQGATWVSNSDQLGQMMVHNYSIGSEARRNSNQSSFKVGQASWAPGTTSIGVTVSTNVVAAQRANISFGRSRVIVIPYKTREDDDTTLSLQQLRNAYQLDPDYIEPSDPFTDVDPPTPEEINETNAASLRWEVTTQIEAIDLMLLQTYTSGNIHDLLLQTRQEILGLQDLPGTYTDIYNEFTRLSAIVKPYTSINFRFE